MLLMAVGTALEYLHRQIHNLIHVLFIGLSGKLLGFVMAERISDHELFQPVLAEDSRYFLDFPGGDFRVISQGVGGFVDRFVVPSPNARHPGIPRLMLDELKKPGNGPAKCIIRQTLSTYRQPVVSLLDFGVEQQRITPNIDTEAAAVLYLGAIQGLVVQSMVGGDIRPLEQLAPHIFRLLSASFQEIPDDSKK